MDSEDPLSVYTLSVSMHSVFHLGMGKGEAGYQRKQGVWTTDMKKTFRVKA